MNINLSNAVVIDLETSCLPYNDRRGNQDFGLVCVIEAAALRIEDRAEWHRLIRLPAGCTISQESQSVHGITQDKLASEGVTMLQAMQELHDFMGQRMTLVGHNAWGFDLRALREDCKQRGCSITPSIEYSMVIDTMMIWRAWCLGRRLMPFQDLDGFYGEMGAARSLGLSNLEHCYHTLVPFDQRVRIGMEQTHRALDDCRMALAVLEAMCDRQIIDRVLGELWEDR